MPIWEWIPDNSEMAAEIELRHDGMDDEGNFGDVHKILRKKPIRRATFGATWLTTDESNAFFALLLAGTLSYTLTDFMGRTWSGTIEKYREQPTSRGLRKYDATLSLLDVTRT